MKKCLVNMQEKSGKIAKIKDFIWWLLLVIILLTTPIFGTLSAIIALVLMVLALPLSFSHDKIRLLLEQKMIILFVVAFLIFAISSAFNADSISDMRFIFNFIAFILAIPAYLLARERASKDTAQIILYLCLIGAGLALAMALFDVYVRGLSRAEGFLSGSILFARVGTTLGFIAAMGFFLIKSPIRFIFLLGPIFSIFVVILAGSRGTAIILPILALFFVFLAFIHAKNKLAKLLIITSLLVFCVGVIIFMDELSPRFSNIAQIIAQIVEQGTSNDISVNIRLEFYKTGWLLFTQNPIFGYGWANMPEHVYAILGPDSFTKMRIDDFHFHNDFFSFAVAGGIFGIICLVFFLIAPLVGALYSERDNLFYLRLETIFILLIIYFLSGLTDMVIGYDLPTAMYALLSAIIIGSFRERKINH